MKLLNLVKIFDGIFQKELAWENDSTGFQAGWLDRDIDTILITLDITDSAVEEAITAGAGLLFSHHPLIFDPIKGITSDDPVGFKLLRLIENHISVYVAHTNYDAMDGGLNDLLFNNIGLKNPEVIEALPAGNCGFGRLGSIEPPERLEDVLALLKDRIGLKNLLWMASPGKGLDHDTIRKRKISKIAVINGSANSMAEKLASASLDCDLVVAGEIKYSNAIKIAQSGKIIVLAGHAETEKLAIDGIYDRMKKNKILANIKIIKSKTGYFPWRYYIE